VDTKKILTIPDLHGKSTWKQIFDLKYDYIIFLGDYVDDFTATNLDIFDNLNRIIELKKAFPEKIVLLWGNHEQHYLFGNNQYRCSGFRVGMFPVLHQQLNKEKELFQYAFQYKDHIWTHGGIHVGWWKFRFKGNDKENIADQLNARYIEKKSGIFDPKIECLFDCGWDRGGSAKVGSPLWVDRSSLWLKGLPGVHQIVGHNKVDKIMNCPSRDNGSVTFCDCLDKFEYYHTIEL
jgi:predicted phosphodiesterase